MKIKNDQSGIAHVAMFVLVVVVIGVVGFVGWKVWDNGQSKDSVSDKPKTTTESIENDSSDIGLKEYKNTEYGFSFNYPTNWTLEVNLSDIGRGSLEGEVIVKSPTGTEVLFGPNLGGKGGDCVDDNNQRTTQICTTQNILLVEKLPSSPSTSPVFYYQASFTESIRNGGNTYYYISLGSGDNSPTKIGKTLGTFYGPFEEISLPKGYVTVKVKGKDELIHDNEDYFEKLEVKEATPILKSFKQL
jgi:PsbP-like protein